MRFVTTVPVNSDSGSALVRNRLGSCDVAAPEGEGGVSGGDRTGRRNCCYSCHGCVTGPWFLSWISRASDNDLFSSSGSGVR
jgi:hypothetical protein